MSNLTYLWLQDNQQLTGSIPSELGNLSNLVTLWLSNNQLSGAIPVELGNLSNLRYLRLYYNQLSGTIPVELCNLLSLQDLVLFSNQLSGSLPIELGNLSNLRSLRLSYNQFNGSIPASLGNLSNLQNFQLENNQLSGIIPTELGGLSNLQTLYLNNNQLSGLIPASLGNLLNMRVLYLSGNQLNGSIPSELGNLSNLETLWLYNNQLSGAIPEELGNLTNLNKLYIQNNQLIGCFPPELTAFCSLGFSTNIYGPGYNFTNNPGLPGGGDFQAFCTNGTGSCITPPSCTSLSSPANGAVDVSVSSNLNWAAPAEAAGYRLTIGASPGGTDILDNVDVGNVTAYDPGPLPYNTTIYVTVIPYNAAGEAAACTEESFTTVGCPDMVLRNLSYDNGVLYVEFTNIGTAQADLTRTNASFSYSPDGSPTTAYASRLEFGDFGPYLAPGESWVHNVNVDPNYNNYPYFVGAVDVFGELEECDETNNISVFTLTLGCADPSAHNYNPDVNSDDGSCETCSDGVQNGDETGVDCGGSLCAACVNPCRESDSLALVALYNATNGPNWTNTWDLTQPMDTWYGVALNSEGCVAQVIIVDNGLNGVLPGEIGNLSNLSWLAFDRNQLSGSIPVELGNLSHLIFLSFFDNELSGSIPAELGSLNQLGALNLSTNYFSGNIPVELSNLSNLGTLVLSNNQLTGNIPPELSNCGQLRIVHLLNNQLNGSIPGELADLSNLFVFYCQKNQLSGCFPEELSALCNINYNFTNNPGLPGGGDFQAFCTTGAGSCSAPPLCTSLSSPADGAADVSVESGLSWAAAQFATGYRLTIGTSPGGEDILSNADVGNVTTYNPGALPPGATIYVTITPYNANGDAAGCTEESFQTAGCPDLVIENISYNNGLLYAEITNAGTVLADLSGINVNFSYSPDGNPTNSFATQLQFGNFGPYLNPGASHILDFMVDVNYLDHPNLVGQVDVLGEMAECDETNNITVFALTLGCTNPAAHNYNPDANSDDGSCQTCTDGVQNGDETGVDCGGALCPPCPCHLAEWTMGPSGTFTFDPTFAAQDVAAGSISRGTGTGGIAFLSFGNPPASFALLHVDSPTFDDQDYFEVSLSTTAGGFDFTSLSVDMVRGEVSGNLGPTDWQVRSNLDNYATVIASGGFNALDVWETKTISLSGLGATPSAITFRVYAYGASGGTFGRWYLDNVILCGEIVPCTDVWYYDGDGDSFGDPDNSMMACIQPAGYVPDNGDCNDADPAVNPDAAEVCDGIDNDCNGFTDNDDPGLVDNTAPDAVCQPFTAQLDVTGNASILASDVDGGSDDACGIASRMVAPDAFSCDQLGDHVVTLTVTDNNGLSASCTATVTVQGPDADGDGICDLGDACPFDPDNDLDGDGVCGDVDNCPEDANPDQYDLDMDGIGYVCDPLILIDEVVEGLNTFVEDLNLSPGVSASIIRRLDIIVSRYCRGSNPATIISSLNSLIHYIEAQAGNQIPVEDANYIITQITALIEAINAGTVDCSNVPGANARLVTGVTNADIQLELFPNPATDELNIRVSGLEADATLVVYDKLGRTIWTAQLEAGQPVLKLPLAENRYANGLYVVRLVADKQIVARRLIVNR